MTCPNCGAAVPASSSFCISCGNMVEIPTTNQYDQYIEPNEIKQDYNEQPEKTKREINVKALIRLIVIALVLIIIIIAILIPVFSLNSEKKQVKDFDGLNVYLPKESKETKGTYLSLKEAVAVGIVATDSNGYTDGEFIQEVIDNEPAEITCGTISSKSINGIKWRYVDCKNSKENIKIYTNIKNDKAYTIVVGYNKQDKKVSEKYITKLEKHLDFK